jgi:hypothetical protein
VPRDRHVQNSVCPFAHDLESGVGTWAIEAPSARMPVRIDGIEGSVDNHIAAVRLGLFRIACALLTFVSRFAFSAVICFVNSALPAASTVAPRALEGKRHRWLSAAGRHRQRLAQ